MKATLGSAISALGRTLIVLDSCEDVAVRAGSTGSSSTGGELLADLMRRCPRARFLATSQQLLRAPGETAFEVQPLASEDGAVELFFERARAARNGHGLSDAARGVVVEIVKKLDGVPLAIELAAARAATESPSEILQRLGRLGHEAQTLKAAIGLTWTQLADDEKRAFRQASVFRGGFDLEAAEAVLDLGEPAGDGAVDDRSRTIDVLERLKGRSLIVSRAQAGAPRFSMLEALRGFATERLEESGERAAVEARHAGYFVSLGKKLAAGVEKLDPEADRRLSLGSSGPRIRRAPICTPPSTSPPRSTTPPPRRARSRASAPSRSARTSSSSPTRRSAAPSPWPRARRTTSRRAACSPSSAR
jgi:predicted ATPase